MESVYLLGSIHQCQEPQMGEL